MQTKQRDPYTQFAAVYDQAEHLEICQSFLKVALPIIGTRRRNTPILDLGCGTGLLAEMLARKGRPVLGVDRSPQMLEIARDRCAHHTDLVEFIEADLLVFELPEKYDFAVATNDIINHFPPKLVGRILKQAAANLADNGTLIFDTLNRFCYRHYWTESAYFMQSEAGDVAMECDWDEQRSIATVDMVAYVRDADGRFTKTSMTLTEYHHPASRIRKALKAAGFKSIKRTPWSPWPDQDTEPALDRDLWIARK